MRIAPSVKRATWVMFASANVHLPSFVLQFLGLCALYAYFTFWVHTLRNKCKSKGSAYSITERIGSRSWSRFLVVSLHVTWVINRAVGCHYFPPGPQLPPQPLRGLLPISMICEQRHDGCEQFAYDCYPTASRLRFEPGPLCAWVQHANHSATEPPCVINE